jgi:predicted RNA-binding protein Jag
MDANKFMPALLAVITDIEAQTNLLVDKGIEHSDQSKAYADINDEISTHLLKIFETIGIKEKVLSTKAEKGILIDLWGELVARVNAYNGSDLVNAISKLLELKNKQRELFTHLPPFTRLKIINEKLY